MSQGHFSRRKVIIAASAMLGAASTSAFALSPVEKGPNFMSVVKDPGCGCCVTWAELAVEAGFEVEVSDNPDFAGMKREAGVPEDFWSCHTTRIGGYIVEGHVPFAAIRFLLEKKPDIIGIAVPGMPDGSPGMGGGVDAGADVIAWGGVAGEGRWLVLDE